MSVLPISLLPDYDLLCACFEEAWDELKSYCSSQGRIHDLLLDAGAAIARLRPDKETFSDRVVVDQMLY